jgi:hypothetical protein
MKKDVFLELAYKLLPNSWNTVSDHQSKHQTSVTDFEHTPVIREHGMRCTKPYSSSNRECPIPCPQLVWYVSGPHPSIRTEQDVLCQCSDEWTSYLFRHGIDRDGVICTWASDARLLSYGYLLYTLLGNCISLP